MRRALMVLALFAAPLARAEEPRPIPSNQFDQVFKLIKRQPGEWAWSEVDWSINFADAQRRSIAEGKPIFVVLAAQGCAIGCV